MSFSFTITGDTPEDIRKQVAWLAQSVGADKLLSELQAGVVAAKAVTRAKKESAAQEPAPSEPISAASAKTEGAPAAADLTVPELMELAAAKSAVVGTEKVKETIASFGAKTIRQLDVSKFPELKAALNDLS